MRIVPSKIASKIYQNLDQKLRINFSIIVKNEKIISHF